MLQLVFRRRPWSARGTGRRLRGVHVELSSSSSADQSAVLAGIKKVKDKRPKEGQDTLLSGVHTGRCMYEAFQIEREMVQYMVQNIHEFYCTEVKKYRWEIKEK